MAQEPVRRINVTLDAAHAEKLARLAEQSNLQEGTLARALLSTAIDDAPDGARSVTDLLLRIPGATERLREGIADADAGRTIPLEDLGSWLESR